LVGATLNIPQYSGGGGGGAAGGPHVITAPVEGRIYGLKNNGTPTTVCTTATNRMTLMPFVPNNNIKMLDPIGSPASFYINVVTAGAVNCKIVIYSDSAGQPLTKLYESASISCATTGQKAALSTISPLVKGTTYWIGTITSGVGPTLTQYSIDSMLPISENVGGATNWFLSTGAYSFAAVPATIVNPFVFAPSSVNCPAVYIQEWFFEE
jgi:hypothetical protein